MYDVREDRAAYGAKRAVPGATIFLDRDGRSMRRSIICTARRI